MPLVTIEEAPIGPGVVAPPLQQWPTGIAKLDALTAGGYGCTIFGGSPKAGKSMAALGAAVMAADTGWKVVYIDAELTAGEWNERLLRFVSNNLPADVQKRLHLLIAKPGVSIQGVIDLLEPLLQVNCERLLIVIDSINRITKNSGGDYWSTFAQWELWATQLPRLSDGVISTLIVSELNQKGATKGAALEYSANMVVQMTTEDSAPDIVDINCRYSRRTRAGPCGEHTRASEEGRFYSLGDVNDGGFAGRYRDE